MILVFAQNRKRSPSPEGCLVVELGLQEILQVNLCHIVHNVSEGGKTVKGNNNAEGMQPKRTEATTRDKIIQIGKN